MRKAREPLQSPDYSALPQDYPVTRILDTTSMEWVVVTGAPSTIQTALAFAVRQQRVRTVTVPDKEA